MRQRGMKLCILTEAQIDAMGTVLPELYKDDDAEYVKNNPYAKEGVTSPLRPRVLWFLLAQL